MKISGFTMCRNAEKLYYPIKESIESALPLVDEFVVVIGDCDPDDRTEELVKSIDSHKVKVFYSIWDLKAYPNGMVHAQQTDLAKSYCTGDWLLYLQADEVLHEAQLDKIKASCQKEYTNTQVQGFVLDYIHFWGDYQHQVKAHSWYRKEIRIIRNLPEIHSWQSAQSFRWINDFDGKSYRKKEGTKRLQVKSIPGIEVFHYGWVRPPGLMTRKMNALDKIHSHKQERFNEPFDYGDLSKLEEYRGSHPACMQKRMAQLTWKTQLNYGSQPLKRLHRFKHERLKYRVLSLIENKLLGGKKIAGFENYKIIP